MLALLLASLVAVTPEPPGEAPFDVQPLRWDPRIDLPVTAALGAGWLLSEYAFKSQLAPSRCVWCDSNPLDNGVRTLFGPTVGVTGDSLADQLSNVGIGFLAVASIGLDAFLAWRNGGEVRDWLVDLTVIFEATFAAMAVNQLVKFSVARERPYVHQLSPEQKPFTNSPTDNNVSFFSGHTTFSVTLAVAAGTVAQLRGYRGAWMVWALGIPVAIATSLLRISADKHYFTDLLVASLVGAGLGLGLPRIFHSRLGPLTSLQLVPAADGLAVAGRF